MDAMKIIYLGCVKILLIVAVGGAVGAVLRVAVGMLMRMESGTLFPWPTLIVNVTGCLAIGALGAMFFRQPDRPMIITFLVPGVLGGYTTFSGFSFEALQLFHTGKYSLALAYMLGTNLLCIGAVAAGFFTAARWIS
jgi:CrcB protein